MIFEADPAERSRQGAGIPHRRRRLRPVDLRVPRRRHPQHQRVRARLPGREGRAARAELPVDAEHPERGERRHRPQLRPQGQEAVDRRRRGREDHRLHRLLAARRGAVRRRRDRGAAPRRASTTRRWRCSTAPTRSPVRWRRSSSARRCRTRSWAARSSTSAPRSRTPWRTSSRWRIRPTRWRCGASSTGRAAASAT